MCISAETPIVACCRNEDDTAAAALLIALSKELVLSAAASAKQQTGIPATKFIEVFAACSLDSRCVVAGVTQQQHAPCDCCKPTQVFAPDIWLRQVIIHKHQKASMLLQLLDAVGSFCLPTMALYSLLCSNFSRNNRQQQS
jgi:hypothetical protein